jgi:hypothetical protein
MNGGPGTTGWTADAVLATSRSARAVRDDSGRGKIQGRPATTRSRLRLRETWGIAASDVTGGGSGRIYGCGANRAPQLGPRPSPSSWAWPHCYTRRRKRRAAEGRRRQRQGVRRRQ